ncbi:MAG: TldD/PmbA family protein [Firmicutes bacterium]|nr:TldD/PmbA family protein [Bacillota bacterium]
MSNEKIAVQNSISYALKQGADDCEIYWGRRSSASTQMRAGEISDDNASDRSGYSVRVIKNGVSGFSYGVALSEESLRRSVDDALLSCGFLEKNDHYHFTAPGKAYPEIEQHSAPFCGFSEKKEYLDRMFEAAQCDPRISKVERTAVSETMGSVRIMNSLGLDLYRESSYVSASATVVSSEGEEEYIGSEFKAAPNFSEIDYDLLGKKAAEDGLDKLGASPIDTAELPVLFCPDAVIDLLGILLPSFLGDHVEKGMSRFKDYLGEKIAADGIYLYDDALMAESVLKIPFDDEGQPCGKNCLIRDGVANMFLYNNEYASRANTESTGNGFCSSHKSLPSVGLSSFYLQKGDRSLDSVVGSLKKGLWVKDLMGLHMADAVSGNFSLGAVGKLIENGEVTKGVRGVMVAGNLFDLLKDVEALCDDFTVFGDVGAPSFLINSLKISGK